MVDSKNRLVSRVIVASLLTVVIGNRHATKPIIVCLVNLCHIVAILRVYFVANFLVTVAVKVR